uniref:(northern house mosquito) hypothetical protein n=1 Tax=Culex pipiens TaxID=7175 RepID=A0A8D8BNE2_CULPI
MFSVLFSRSASRSSCPTPSGDDTKLRFNAFASGSICSSRLSRIGDRFGETSAASSLGFSGDSGTTSIGSAGLSDRFLGLFAARAGEADFLTSSSTTGSFRGLRVARAGETSFLGLLGDTFGVSSTTSSVCVSGISVFGSVSISASFCAELLRFLLGD